MPAFIVNVPIVTSTPTIAVEGLPVGTHRFQLVVEDESGNRSQPSFGTVTVLNPAPLIRAISPEFGPWGELVVITGFNFTPDPPKNRVSFNGVAAQVVSATSTQLTVRVPQPATTGLVKVATGAGEWVHPRSFVIPRVFTIEVGNADIASQPIDLALDTPKGNLWVLNKGPVINSKRGVVAVINLEQKKLLNFIFVGDSPIAIATAAAGERRVCVVLNSGGVVSAIDLDSMKVANIQVAGNPVALDISPDGKWVYVLLPVALPGLGASPILFVIDMTAFKVVGTIPVGRAPTRVVFSRDSQFAVVNNTGDGTISLIDVKTRKVSAVKVGGSDTSNPQEVVFSQKNFPMWTANSGSRNASVIGKDMLAANIDLDLNPMAVAVNSDGTRAFLMGPKETLMAMVVTAEGQPIQKIISKMSGVAGNVEAIATTPDDRGVIAIHANTNTMSVLETKTLGLRAVISLNGAPLRCLITNDGKFAVVVCPKILSILDMESVLPTGA